MRARLIAWLLKWFGRPEPLADPAPAPPPPTVHVAGAPVVEEQEDALLAAVWQGGFEAGQRLALELEAERLKAAFPAELAAMKRALARYSSVPAGRVFGVTGAEEYAASRGLDAVRTGPAQAPGLNGSG